MALSARDRQRLQQLAHQLPPESAAQPATPQPGAPRPATTLSQRIERETDPQALFEALMQASPDGQVPPHWLERLRELEQQRQQRQDAEPAQGTQPRRGRQQGKPLRQPAPADQQLYTAFEQLLLEDEEL